MRKGINPDSAERILGESHRAGIWNNIFVIFCFPGETEEDMKETSTFILRNRGTIDSLAYTDFRLEKGADVYKKPKQYGLELIDVPSTYFGPVFPFRYNSGLKSSEITERLNVFNNLLKEHTHLSMIFNDGLSPLTLKLALNKFGSKTPLLNSIKARAERYRYLNSQGNRFDNITFKIAPYKYRQLSSIGDDDYQMIILVEHAGRVIKLNSAGAAILEQIGNGYTIKEILYRLWGPSFPESAIKDSLDFVRDAVWRGLLIPACNYSA